MALTIDKSQTAVVALDLENDIVDERGAFKGFGFAAQVKERNVLSNAMKVLGAARKAKVFVMYVGVKYRPGYPERAINCGMWQAVAQSNALVEGSWGSQVHADVAPLPGEPVLAKHGISAFCSSDLGAILRTKGIRNLFLMGVATNFVVEGTAREASDMGYNVYVVEDCCAAASKEAHEMALKSALPALTTIVKSDEVIAALK